MLTIEHSNDILPLVWLIDMNVTKTDNMYKASRISGPKHNYLGIVVTEDVRVTPNVVERTLNVEQQPSCIDKERLVTAVSGGVREGNREYGSAYHIEVIEFVSSDTPDYDIYTMMAKAIVKAAVADA